MVWVAEGVNVLVEVKVRVGVEVSIREGVGLIKRVLTAGFDENNQAPITKIPNTRLNTQKLVTILPSDFEEDLGINLPPMRCDAGYQAPCLLPSAVHCRGARRMSGHAPLPFGV